MRKTPTGQRPRINPKSSAGWSWPRLLPIHEQQVRASLESQSSSGPSKSHARQPENEREHSQMHTSNEPAAAVTPLQSPISTAVGPAEADLAATIEINDHQPPNETGGSVSPISVINAQPLDAGTENLPEHAVSELAKDVNDEAIHTPEQVHTEPNMDRDIRSKTNEVLSPASENDRMPQPMADGFASEDRSLAEKVEEDSVTKHRKASTGTGARRPSIQSVFGSQSMTSNPGNGGPSDEQQLGASSLGGAEPNVPKATVSDDEGTLLNTSVK